MEEERNDYQVVMRDATEDVYLVATRRAVDNAAGEWLEQLAQQGSYG